MLTPRFSCSQTEESVILEISVSHIRFDAPGVQIIVEENLFIFSLSPYYLRLRFDKPLIDDEDHPAKATYESKDEKIVIVIPKLKKGDVFEDLDLPKKLMARVGEDVEKTEVMDTKALLQEIGVGVDQGLINEVGVEKKEIDVKAQKKPLIEVIGETKNDLEETAIEGDKFNWEINQNNEQEDSVLKVKYGFNNLYDSIISVSISNGNDINELDDPEHTKPDDRIKERLLKENYKFDPEYYAADFMTTKYSDEDDYSQIKDLLKWENPIIKETEIKYTKEEDEQMMNLPKKINIISNPKPLYYTIISLLFSFCFESRETEGELNGESAWSIGKLTPQLSFLDQKIILDDVKSSMIKAIVITSIRRSLSYPLHRNFELSFKAWIDAVNILKKGKKLVLKSLLAIHEAFRFHDIYYVYNKILIDDLINWLINDSRDNDFVLKSLGQEIEKNLMSLEKNEIVFEQLDEDGDVDTSLNILEIEQIAEEMYKQGQTT